MSVPGHHPPGNPPPPPSLAYSPPPPPSDFPPPPPPPDVAPPPPPTEPAPPPPPPISVPPPAPPSAISPEETLSEREQDLLIARERNSLYQELELDRVMAAFKLDPYDILDLPLEADEKTVTKAYRKKSLLLHPDKVKDPRAVEAFDLLKKASAQLLDKDKRSNLDETVITARMLVLKDLGLPGTTPRTDAALKKLEDKGMVPSFDERVRKETKAIMIDDELRRRKAIRLQHAAEGEAERKKEEAIAERKRKAEDSVRWEETREERVAGWRTFQKGGKKKRKDDGVLG